MLQIKEAVRSTFLRHNAVLFFGSMVTAGLNYIYYPVLSRMMGLADFGEVQALVTIFLQATIFLAVIGIVIVNIVNNMPEGKERDTTLADFEILVLSITTTVFILIIALARPIQSLLHFESYYPFIALAVSLQIGVIATIRTAFLRGYQRFGTFSLITSLNSMAKLIFSALLVYIGLKTLGAMLGIIIAQLITLAYASLHARRLGFHGLRIKNLRLPTLKNITPHAKYSLFVLVITLLITLQFSVDILVVKRHFSPDVAGLYAGLTTVARIVFFLTGSVAMVLLSSVQIADMSGNNRRMLVRSGILLMILGGVTLIVFSLVPELVLNTLIGNKYILLAPLLPKLGLAVFIISGVNLLLSYCMALKLYNVIFPTIAGALITYVLLIIHHDSLQQVIQSIFIGSTAFACLVGGWAVLQLWQMRTRRVEA